MSEGRRKAAEEFRKKRAAWCDEQIAENLKEIRRLNKILRLWGRK